MPKSGVPLRGNLRVHVFKGLRLRVWLGELSRPLYSRLPLACELLRFGYLRRRHFPSEEIPERTAYGVVPPQSTGLPTCRRELHSSARRRSSPVDPSASL
jgi:hypothetical protein